MPAPARNPMAAALATNASCCRPFTGFRAVKTDSFMTQSPSRRLWSIVIPSDKLSELTCGFWRRQAFVGKICNKVLERYDGDMTRKLYIETVGCQMNVLDSELVVGSLRRHGYELAGSPAEADL